MKPIPNTFSTKAKNTLYVITGVFLSPGTAFAYELLEPLPQISSDAEVTLTNYVANVFNLGIAFAGVLAVLMIVIGGIQYIGSGMSPSAKEDAKERITNAILGLLLALGSWLILHTINPAILSSSSPTTFSENNINQSRTPSASPIQNQNNTNNVRFNNTSRYNSYSSPPNTPTTPSSTSDTDSFLQDVANFVAESSVDQLSIYYDPQNDFSLQTWCMEQRNTSGECSKADINGDGELNVKDSIPANAFRYDINNDGILSAVEAPAVSYCLFKSEQDPQNPSSGIPHPPSIPIPETYPSTLYAAYQLPNSLKSSGWNPALSGCAGRSISPSYFDLEWMRQQLLQSGGSRINLNHFYQNFYQITCDYESQTCTWRIDSPDKFKFAFLFSFSQARQQLAKIFYSTLHQFDLNDDLIADLRSNGPDIALLDSCMNKPKPSTGLCARADFDNNGVVNEDDRNVGTYFINNMMGSSVLLPPDWSLKDYEIMERKPDNSYPDLATINYCKDSRLIGSCGFADVNLSCSPPVNSCTSDQVADRTCPINVNPNCRIDANDRASYLDAVLKFDLNGDGIVNIR